MLPGGKQFSHAAPHLNICKTEYNLALNDLVSRNEHIINVILCEFLSAKEKKVTT